MTTFGELKTTVLDATDDDSVLDHHVSALINQGIKWCASKVRLPDLESSGVFDTVADEPAADIPIAWLYHRGLYAAAVPTGNPIKVVASIGLIKDKYPEIDNELIEGPIQFLTIRSGQLIYYPVPEVVTTVYCKFYEVPFTLAKSKDVPTYLPDHLHGPLLESYALWKVYAKIEDGNEGSKINTKYYKNEFKEAFDELDDDIDEGQSAPTPLRESSWI
jgi:hypothetical protein